MKLVSAAKLKKAQDAAFAGRQFRLEIQRALVLAVQNLPEDYSHSFLTAHETQSSKAGAKTVKIKTRVYAVSGERGLCGAFNANLIKAVVAGENVTESEMIAVGKKANSAAVRFKWNLTAAFEGLPEDISLWPIEEMVNAGFKESETAQVVKLYFTQFISTLTQRVTEETLLPFDIERMKKQVSLESSQNTAVKLDPSAIKVFEYLAPIYLRARLREAALESRASEHAARMTAMDSATNNASDLIDKLQLFYNRARQSAITTELIDIIGGSSAVE
jgi:F-type H+-transporting ATPase subunit gamma